MSRLRIAEIFTSIQGEGIWAGVPSTFVRVSGCNLRCVWCDTPYASWAPEGPILEVDDIVDKVIALSTDHVVVTGGEPMLFEPIAALTRALKARGRTITIETAGTVFRDVACDLMSISPKLRNSAPVDGHHADASVGPLAVEWIARHDAERLNPSVLRKLIQSYPFQLKFVVDPDEHLDDLSEIAELLDALEYDIPRDRILLMPEGIDTETLHRRLRLLAPVCIEHGYRLSPRLHVDLYGNTRGT